MLCRACKDLTLLMKIVLLLSSRYRDADQEQQENSKVSITPQGRSCSSCFLKVKKKCIHVCVCKLVCSGALL